MDVIHACVFLFFFCVISANDAKQDTLWQKAAQIAVANWNLIPGKMHKIKHVTDKKGREKGHKEVIIRYFLTDGNQIGSELIQATINGKNADTKNKYVNDTMEEVRLPVNRSLFHNNDEGNPVVL